MRTRRLRSPRSLWLVCVALAVLAGLLAAEAGRRPDRRGLVGDPEPEDNKKGDIRIRRLEGLGSRGFVRTPVYRVDAAGAQNPPGDWAQVTTEYNTALEWIDELMFRYYVLTETTEEGKKVYSLFRATVAYADIDKGRHWSTVYLRPKTVKRYGKPVAIGVEILFQSKVVAEESEVSLPTLPKQKWWENQQMLQSPLLKTKDGYLLNRNQTPFAFVNTDDYEVIK